MASWNLLFGLLAAAQMTRGSTDAAVVGCQSDQECLDRNDTNWRCLVLKHARTPGALPCTIDAAFNGTGVCACGDPACSEPSYAAPVPGMTQYLVVGDSVSEGLFGSLAANLSAHKYQTVHAPGNSDNTNWGRRCLEGWLGPDPHRWDVITFNFGLHDLAYPDNEHLDVPTYSKYLQDIAQQLKTLTRAKVMWVTTTPVPTNPPPQKGKNPAGNDNCTLVPGRLEVNVQAYNRAAATALGGGNVPHTCDLHAAVEAVCGANYRACAITQCGGPHYSQSGFAMLGQTLGQCVLGVMG